MTDNSLFNQIVAVIFILITILPVINFWLTIFKKSQFQDKYDLLIFTLFRLPCDIAIAYLLYKMIDMTESEPSLVPFFIFAHLLGFAGISVAIEFTIGFSMLPCPIKFKSVTRKHKVKMNGRNGRFKKFFDKYYNISPILDTKEVMSTEFSKKVLMFSYVFSGILAVSNFANGLMINIYNRNPAINKSFQQIFSSDQQLYGNIFIVSVIPLIISHMMNTKKEM